jgi:hypothetical protein
MADERWEPAMPALDRQAVGGSQADAPVPGVPAFGAAATGVKIRVPETAPTPLQRHYIELSAPALVAGAVAITALETGSMLTSPLVKVCVLVGAPLLVIANADATLRIWRSAWAWMPVNRGRGLFRLAWVAAAAIGLALIAAAAAVVLTA